MSCFQFTPRPRFRGGVMVALVVACVCVLPVHCTAQSTGDEEFTKRKADAEKYFRKSVAPFIKSYCIDCHQNRRPTEAGINFSPALTDPGHAAFAETWKRAAAIVKAHDMPPEDLEQPTEEERQRFVEWQARVKFLSDKDPGPFVIRRLTKTEYGNTLHDLFGVDPSIADSLPDEVSGAGYLNSLSQLQLEQYLGIAEQVLNQSLGTEGKPTEAQPTENEPLTEIQKRLLRKPPTEPTNARATAKDLARSLAKRVYRRPATDTELDVLLMVFDLGQQNKLGYSSSLRLMLKAMLVSPQFLFITPAEEVDSSAEIVPLDDYQLASRLSYLLWATMPDDELMDLADQRKLHEPQVLEAQVVRLLNDPRSRALFDGFGAQWLGLGELEDRKFDAAQFPLMTGEMRLAMVDEVRLMFGSIVRENQSVVSFIDSDYTFLDENLAKIYGLQSEVSGAEMRRVQLTDKNRGGILGMPAILAATSFPTRTSPVKRGVWVLEQVLGDHVPPAPPDVPALEVQDQAAVADMTLRERTELHRTDPVCANCHNLLDPIGFGLENFDAIGRWRVKDDNGQAIDATGELPDGTRISSPQELKANIAGQIDVFARNLVERLLAYALCRNLEGYDEIVIDELMTEISSDDYRMQTLVRAVVTSYPFTYRRVVDKKENQ